MQIKDYTTPELEHFRAACNFTGLEREFFDLRAAGVTIESCGEVMGYSIGGIRHISGNVKRKMNRV